MSSNASELIPVSAGRVWSCSMSLGFGAVWIFPFSLWIPTLSALVLYLVFQFTDLFSMY